MIYLAGGTHTNWQDVVIQAFPKEDFFDPRTVKDKEGWFNTEIETIKNSKLMFAYMEDTNPVGYNLAFEIGVAYTLMCPVILVINPGKRGWDMPRDISLVCEDLETGILRLTEILRGDYPL